MFQAIMVPLDGSGFGEQALPLAAGLAKCAGARLELVRVYARLAEWEDVSAHVALATERIVDALEGHAARVGADLVVMSTHGRGGVARAWLGSVADGLIRRLGMPLLLVKPQEGPPDPGVGPPFRRILVPLDGSSASETVLDAALDLALATGARLRLLAVLATTGAAAAVASALNLDDHRGSSDAYLARARDAVMRRGVPVETRVVVNGSPVGAILEEAATRGVDLVAMATHGRGGAARLLLGSVGDKVVRGSRVPVLVQRIPRLSGAPLAPA